MPAWRSAAARWRREPLVQFLAIGALIFVVFQWWGGWGPGSNRIVITSGQIDSLVTGFARTWQRPPTDEELKGLLDELLREEIATREAMAMGLDRDDTVVRRRLRQKLEFLVEDSVDATAPTDAELRAWLDAHPQLFRREPRLTFRQVFLSPDRRKASLEEDARRLREQLSRSGPDTAIETLGDSLMLESDVERATRSDVARLFGEGFAAAILEVEPGRWVGPIRSGYGLHVVLVREREDGRMPTLTEVRPQLDREVTADRRRRQLDAMYARLLERYHVVVEKGAGASRVAGPTSPRPPDAVP